MTTRPVRDPSDNAWIHRSGLRTNAVGDIRVECPP
ncbi:Uncharacterised protein [Mycobacterium tuberculosis]|nr:Uncharacterised protein [Mycobacterium tuberculosis]COY07515.1 Uncharacterised protein [Mycobacterium tuberculosis]